MRVSWPAASDDTALARYRLQRSTDDGATWRDVSLPGPLDRRVDVRLTPGSRAVFRLRAIDTSGNASRWVVGAASTLKVMQETASSIVYRGSWTRASLSGASGGKVSRATVAGRRATITVTAAGLAVVSNTGPDRGIVEIRVDGARVATVDLYSATRRKARVVWAASLPSGQHALELRATGKQHARSRSSRIDLDAILVLRSSSAP